MNNDVLADAEASYVAAMQRRAEVEAAWKAEGSPLLAEGSQGQMVEHPYLKMLRAQDLLLDTLRSRLRKAHAGPEPRP
jgi:hypothetical protein